MYQVKKYMYKEWSSQQAAQMKIFKESFGVLCWQEKKLIKMKLDTLTNVDGGKKTIFWSISQIQFTWASN